MDCHGILGRRLLFGFGKIWRTFSGFGTSLIGEVETWALQGKRYCDSVPGASPWTRLSASGGKDTSRCQSGKRTSVACW